MRKKISLLSVLALCACGTIFNGGTQDISFDSNIKDVEIYINGMKICKTPCVYPMERSSSSFVVVAKKKGYEDQQQIMKSSFSNASILNLTFWPSWLTDVASGGMWRYSREGIYIDMEKTTKQAELQIKKDVATRRFALLNYGELKIEAAKNQSGDYITALSSLSGISEKNLISVINDTSGEVKLAHRLTNIK